MGKVKVINNRNDLVVDNYDDIHLLYKTCFCKQIIVSY